MLIVIRTEPIKIYLENLYNSNLQRSFDNEWVDIHTKDAASTVRHVISPFIDLFIL